MWIPFREIDFSDKSITQYHIDTRDFHGTTGNEPVPDSLDLHKTLKYPNKYFHTALEIIELLDRYYNESGGKGEWRMFSLAGGGKFRTEGWQLKYIRIYRLENGLVVASKRNTDCFVFSKDMLASPVNKKHLNHG